MVRRGREHRGDCSSARLGRMTGDVDLLRMWLPGRRGLRLLPAVRAASARVLRRLWLRLRPELRVLSALWGGSERGRGPPPVRSARRAETASEAGDPRGGP